MGEGTRLEIAKYTRLPILSLILIQGMIFSWTEHKGREDKKYMKISRVIFIGRN